MSFFSFIKHDDLWGSGDLREFDCDVYPQGGNIYHLIFQLQRAEEKEIVLLTIMFLPGGGDFDNFVWKMSKSHLMPDPPPPPPSWA